MIDHTKDALSRDAVIWAIFDELVTCKHPEDWAPCGRTDGGIRMCAEAGKVMARARRAASRIISMQFEIAV